MRCRLYPWFVCFPMNTLTKTSHFSPNGHTLRMVFPRVPILGNTIGNLPRKVIFSNLQGVTRSSRIRLPLCVCNVSSKGVTRNPHIRLLLCVGDVSSLPLCICEVSSKSVMRSPRIRLPLCICDVSKGVTRSPRICFLHTGSKEGIHC